MGLDMYLYRKTYVKNWEHMKKEQKHTITVKRGGLVRKDIDPKKITYIVEELGYWRKANAIHKWFVENVQGGEDNCQQHYVPLDKARELLGLCNKVLEASELIEGKVNNGYTFNEKMEKVYNTVDGKVIKNPKVAQELLPTTEGFFFGGTDYDEWYLRDIEDTKKILEEALKNEDSDIYYESSW